LVISSFKTEILAFEESFKDISLDWLKEMVVNNNSRIVKLKNSCFIFDSLKSYKNKKNGLGKPFSTKTISNTTEYPQKGQKPICKNPNVFEHKNN
jgi:hypothetical protein